MSKIVSLSLLSIVLSAALVGCPAKKSEEASDAAIAIDAAPVVLVIGDAATSSVADAAVAPDAH